jgi:triacylglycerol lipase
MCHRRSILGTLLTLLISLPLLAPVPATAQERRQYPVPYTMLAGVTAGLTTPGAPPPGSNDWSCRPSPAHPNPVVLVHGLSANMTVNWQTFSPLLANTGYWMFALTYGVNPAAANPRNNVLRRRGEEHVGAQVGGVLPMERTACWPPPARARSTSSATPTAP